MVDWQSRRDAVSGGEKFRNECEHVWVQLPSSAAESSVLATTSDVPTIIEKRCSGRELSAVWCWTNSRWVGFVGRVLYIEGSTGETLNVRSLISDIRLILVARPSG